jgi:oxygen-dependent protoporphyrinogen oxidase
MAQPMVGGIYTADPETLSLRATLPRFLEMEREHRSVILAMLRNATNGSAGSGVSGARYSLFLSFDRGLQVIADALQGSIASSPHAAVRLNTTVEQIAQTEKGTWKIQTNAEAIEADALCLSIPSYASSRLVKEVDSQLADQLDQIRFASTATVNLAFRREDISHPLDGFGFVVPVVEKRSLLACTFSSVKFRDRAPEGHVLLRAFVGGALQPDMFALDKDEMLARVKNDLSDLLGIAGDPLFADVTKWAYSMPQYEVGHLDRMNQIEKQLNELPGLTLAGNSYRGAGIPDCIRSGERAAEKIVDTLS